MMKTYTALSVLIFTTVVTEPIALAAQTTGAGAPPAQPKGGKPPETAISICVNKAPATQCSFLGPRGLELGQCEYTPDKLFFACNPGRPGAAPGRGAKPDQVTRYPSHLAPQPPEVAQ